MRRLAATHRLVATHGSTATQADRGGGIADKGSGAGYEARWTRGANSGLDLGDERWRERGAAGSAAAATYGYPVPGQIGFQLPVTDVARYIQWFHNDILLPVTLAISLFVLALLIYVVWRFNEKANPTPSRTTHNAALEVAWTIVPVIILVFIAVPSFRLLTLQLELPPSDVTIKVTGEQWHWTYAYPKGQGDFSFDSYIKEDKDLKPENGDIRLLVGRQRGGGSGQQGGARRGHRALTSSIPSSSSPSACASMRYRVD